MGSAIPAARPTGRWRIVVGVDSARGPAMRRARENEDRSVLHRTALNHAGRGVVTRRSSAMTLADRLSGLEHKMAKNRLERRVVKRHSSTVGRGPGEVAARFESVARASRKVIRSRFYPTNRPAGTASSKPM